MKRWQRLFVIAAVLACVGGVYRANTHPFVAASDLTQTATGYRGSETDGSPMQSTAMPPRAAAAPPSDAVVPCDVTAPDPKTTEDQDAQYTEAQARYDLALARRLRSTGDPVAQAVASMLGRIEDWAPRELADQVAEVARAAVMTSNAQLYALALKACARLQDEASTVSAPEACSQLSVGQSTLLQPDNVMVWLQAAKAARERQDTAGELDAFYHASLAHQVERPGYVAIGLLRAQMALTDPAWLRYGALRKLAEQIVPDGGWGALHEGVDLSGSCDSHQLDDANLRELCERLARHLLDESAGSSGWWTGTAIGMQLGWTKERLRPYFNEAHPLFMAAESLTPFPPHDCRASVHLDILQASLASDSPVRLSAPQLRSAIDALTQKRQDDEAKESAAQKTEESEAETKATEASGPEPSQP